MLDSLTHFTNTQLIVLVAAAVTLLASMIFQAREKENISLLLLLSTAFLVFSFAALLDPFLNLWDERFHALVGKNLMDHPFLPTLYDDPVVAMAYDRWDRYHIWLHKQPFFLWQIALSFSIFGISEFALRLPNIILGVLLVYAGYRTGKLLISQRTGYITGILIISSMYLLELAGGRQELEHNDFTFLAYISLSIWSFSEYHYSGRKFWVYLTGAFSGIAILCKWLVGLLVYSGWTVLRIQQKKWTMKGNKDLVTSLLVTLLVALPWQVYTFAFFPEEAMEAYRFNVMHVTIPLDGHAGSGWYHFDMFRTIYGQAACYLVVPALFIFYRRSNDRKLFFSMISMVAAVYLFFSLVSTKMPSFTIIVAMIVFIGFASLVDYIIRFTTKAIQSDVLAGIVFVILLISLVVYRFDISFLLDKHTNWKGDNLFGQRLIENKKIFNSLELPDNTVLFNVEGRHYIEAMFYTGLPAYNFIPTKEQYGDLRSRGRRIAVFSGDGTDLPEYIKSDTTAFIIHEKLWKLD